MYEGVGSVWGNNIKKEVFNKKYYIWFNQKKIHAVYLILDLA
jgi:hypothetical protein